MGHPRSAEMTGVRSGQRASRVASVVFAAIVVLGCQTSAATRPINGTTWQITALAGEPVDREVRLALDQPRLGVATLTTPCRSHGLEFAFDTDSAGVSFADAGAPPPDCEPAAKTVDVAISTALADASEWILVSDTTIEIRGGATLVLEESTLPSN